MHFGMLFLQIKAFWKQGKGLRIVIKEITKYYNPRGSFRIRFYMVCVCMRKTDRERIRKITKKKKRRSREEKIQGS